MLKSRFLGQAAIEDVQINADGSRLMILAGGTMSLRDARTEKVVTSMPAVEAKFSPDGRRIASSSLDGSVSLIAADSGDVLAKTGEPRPGSPRKLTYSRDGRNLAATATSQDDQP